MRWLAFGILLLCIPSTQGAFIVFDDPSGDAMIFPGVPAAGTGDQIDITRVIVAHENQSVTMRVWMVSFMLRDGTAADPGADYFVIVDADLQVPGESTQTYRFRFDCITINGLPTMTDGCSSKLYQMEGNEATLVDEIEGGLNYEHTRVDLTCDVAWCEGVPDAVLTNFTVGAYYHSSSGISWLDTVPVQPAQLALGSSTLPDEDAAETAGDSTAADEGERLPAVAVPAVVGVLVVAVLLRGRTRIRP